jgi:hypothetical protein
VLRRVIYDAQEQRRILRGWIHDLSAPGMNWRRELEMNFPTLFTEWLVSFKDPAYREEGEWRLIQFGREFEGDPCAGKVRWFWPAKFRTRGGQVIPYADFDLTHSPALIRQVVFGPTVEAARAATALKLCCEIVGSPLPAFSASKVPFVS